MNFFSELKRRNVYKVAVAYAIAGWALSQGIAQVFPVFDVPNWDELEEAYQRSDTNYLFVLKVDPLFDDLRGNPRFEALVQKVVGPKS